MYRILHFLIVAFYLTAPAVALIADAMISMRKRRGAPSGQLVMTVAAAVIIGTALALIYAVGVGGNVSLGQIFLCIYFAAGLLLCLKLFDWSVSKLLVRGLRGWVRSERLSTRRLGATAVALGRVALLFLIGLPYVMAAVMTYRPHVVPRDDPMQQLGIPFERVTFRSTDGLALSGWFVPAIQGTRNLRDDWGTKTVVACHGLAANKSNQLVIARELLRGGYNVLIFDFRAHGESAGQLTSLGDLERRDVLGAVRYLQENRPQQATRIFGVGASMGAAALISAAADESREGQAIEAVAVYGTYDELKLLARDVADTRFLAPFDRIIPAIGLPMASAQVGTNLGDFKPVLDADKLWPRPILIIHGQMDSVIPFDRGLRLWRLTSPPKYNIWIAEGDHNQIINDDDAALAVRVFFDTSRSIPVL